VGMRLQPRSSKTGQGCNEPPVLRLVGLVRLDRARESESA
jgi:hypothetical protein